MKKENLALGLSVLAIVLSVIAVCFRFEIFRFDFLNFMVVLIALLVAIFVGFQIYQSFTLRNDINRDNDALYKRMIQENQVQIERIKNDVDIIIKEKIEDYDHTISASLYQVLATNLIFGTTHYKAALLQLIKGIHELNKATDKTPLDGIISFIEFIKSKNENISLTQNEVEDCTKALGMTGDSKAIELIPYIQSLLIATK